MASLTHVRVVVDHTLPIQSQRSAKLKNDIALIFIDQCIWPIKSSSTVKNILNNCFAALFLLTTI